MEERKPPFMIQYRHKGSEYALTLWADSWEDAEARLRSIGGNGEVVGSNVQTVPANAFVLPFTSLWVRLVCWWRNLGR